MMSYPMAAPFYFGNNFAVPSVGYGAQYSGPYRSEFSGQSHSYSIPTVAVTSSVPEPEKEESTPYVKKTVDDCYPAVKSVENSVSTAYNTLELDHYKMHQAKSEDYARLYHQAATKLATGRLRFEAVKENLPIGSPTAEELAKNIPSTNFSDEEIKKYFPQTAPISEHPFEELKSLRIKANALRRILEVKVKAQLDTI
jgi:hypothetical protein